MWQAGLLDRPGQQGILVAVHPNFAHRLNVAEVAPLCQSSPRLGSRRRFRCFQSAFERFCVHVGDLSTCWVFDPARLRIKPLTSHSDCRVHGDPSLLPTSGCLARTGRFSGRRCGFRCNETGVAARRRRLPIVSASQKCAIVPAPPDAITGLRQLRRQRASGSRLYPAFVHPDSMLVSRIRPRTLLDFARQSSASMPVAGCARR